MMIMKGRVIAFPLFSPSRFQQVVNENTVQRFTTTIKSSINDMILTPKQSQIPHQEHTPGSLARRNQCLVMESVLHSTVVCILHNYIQPNTKCLFCLTALYVYDDDVTIPEFAAPEEIDLVAILNTKFKFYNRDNDNGTVFWSGQD
ncbi:hypothetical protein PHYBLDRAFT_170674 [Phycomyces blakesleeanus NRRL 1555(-)]|uniref:Uncharacterized protein n=1 Tax=Phycomyces blakesleeanus (strain ATCC 8743b / DSM 1359 / FGSC 10004 / NBRC 33097 / NRRL 1555) TaxID=763407 RepID=A0A167LXN2_PHYB8|nr:hypothetical protein PHYBLDRAFT_170674 [Phycomyces blakesleeanus NRRL 1555(-)]OAD71304.1 hypothetical protein PHYBLDRAFT_170674 [Phycomyces blakesleeanus NRRL 1555(-)]|eukprot:XP_018289344.1 hypothetical protein PHYBLDRAFT_170674 [Phycomyces blakesleeanus NRRL 1555(-)]